MKKCFKFFSFWLLLLGTTTVIFNSCGNVLKNKSTNSSTYDEGVIINGVKWATRNVDLPGTFAAKPEDAGMFYQWNRKKAWAATGKVTKWNNSNASGTTWKKSNDPSPAGWRVPTIEEIKKLLDENKVKREWTTMNGINGYRFTDIAIGNTLFLPAVGYRSYNIGALNTVGMDGGYWSSTQYVSVSAYCLYFKNTAAWGGYARRLGFSIRAVAE